MPYMFQEMYAPNLEASSTRSSPQPEHAVLAAPAAAAALLPPTGGGQCAAQRSPGGQRLARGGGPAPGLSALALPGPAHGGKSTPALRAAAPPSSIFDDVEAAPPGGGASAPPSYPPSPTSAASRGSNRRDEGAQYVGLEDLPPFPRPPEERWILDALSRLSSSADWAEQFGAIDDARRLARFAPRLLVAGGHLRKLAALIASLVDSLRSALAKNALRCIGELFVVFGKRMDPEIDLCLPAILRRAADTNAFIAEEAEVALSEVCRAGTETKLLAPVLAGVAHRRAEIRARAVWCLAMLAQRVRGRGPAAHRELKVITDAAGKAAGDANADVRQSARLAALVLVAEGGGALEEGAALWAKLHACIPASVDPASFDAFNIEAMHRCSEGGRAAPSFSPPGGTRLRSAGTAGFRAPNETLAATRQCASPMS